LALRSLQLSKKTVAFHARENRAGAAWAEYAKTLIIRQQGRLSQAAPKPDERSAETRA
jgi:hypothetical protein